MAYADSVSPLARSPFSPSVPLTFSLSPNGDEKARREKGGIEN